MKKITELTEAQKAKFPQYVDKWIKVGLSTAPANRKKAEAGITKAYKAAGLDKPKIVWCDSPLSMALTRAILMKHGDNIKEKIGDSVRASVRASVGDSVRDSVWASVRASVGDSVWDSVGDSVGDSVWDSVRDSVGDSVRDSGYGQHDASWIGFYSYFRDELGLKEETDKLQGLTEITENAGWFLPHKGICWVSERHCIVKQDDNKRMHCENGPAIQYPDGWSLYYWHGVKVPEWVIMEKDKLTPDLILKEENAEIRRCMQEIYGFQKFFLEMKKQGKVKEIDQKPDISGMPVTLYCYDDKVVKQHFVHVHNGTIEPDGTRHEFTINCKNIKNDAFQSVMGTYPDLMEMLANNPNRLQILKSAIRT